MRKLLSHFVALVLVAIALAVVGLQQTVEGRKDQSADPVQSDNNGDIDCLSVDPNLNKIFAGSIGAASIDTFARQQQPRGGSVSESIAVDYRGVTFRVDRTLTKRVVSSSIPASVDSKPSDTWPEHIGFLLESYPRQRSLPETDPHIRVFSLPKFRRAVAVASNSYRKSVVSRPLPQPWTIFFDEEVRVLKSLLKSKPTQPVLREFLIKARTNTSCGAAMPFLPMWEACQAFIGHVKYVDFNNGRGVFFLTQWNTETSQVVNSGLEYAFQGITNDGQYWIYAEFSVSAPSLPNGDEPAVKAWDTENYLLPHSSEKYQNYLRPVVAKLEATPDNEFRPSLTLLEELIQSLRIAN